MRPEADPAFLTTAERFCELAVILAEGLLCLRDRAAVTSSPTSETPLESEQKPLEAVPDTPLTVHVG